MWEMLTFVRENKVCNSHNYNCSLNLKWGQKLVPDLWIPCWHVAQVAWAVKRTMPVHSVNRAFPVRRSLMSTVRPCTRNPRGRKSSRARAVGRSSPWGRPCRDSAYAVFPGVSVYDTWIVHFAWHGSEYVCLCVWAHTDACVGKWGKPTLAWVHLFWVYFTEFWLLWSWGLQVNTIYASSSLFDTHH